MFSADVLCMGFEKRFNIINNAYTFFPLTGIPIEFQLNIVGAKKNFDTTPVRWDFIFSWN